MTVEPINEHTCLACSRQFIGAHPLCSECREARDRAAAIDAAIRRHEAARQPGRPLRICDLERSAA